MTSVRIRVRSSSTDQKQQELIAQTGDGSWSHLGSTRTADDGVHELQRLIANADDRLRYVWMYQVQVAEALGSDYLSAPERHIGTVAIAYEMLKLVLVLAATSTDRVSVASALKTLDYHAPPTLSKPGTPVTLSEGGRSLYEYNLGKHQTLWTQAQRAVQQWIASGDGSTIAAVLRDVMGPDTVIRIDGPASQTGIILQGAILRETIGCISIMCGTSTCREVTIDPGTARDMMLEFRRRFYERYGRPAGIANGTSRVATIIDLAVVDETVANQRLQ